uniref:Lymphocyte function-associated antigen 3 n=2 Tax=Tursiops truncatus TaxID=9739 RepID=A0A6J3RW83_TURTR
KRKPLLEESSTEEGGGRQKSRKYPGPRRRSREGKKTRAKTSSGAWRDARGGAHRGAGSLSVRQAEATPGWVPVAEAGPSAMAAGSAAGWAVGALGVVCLLLRLDFISCDSQVIYGAVNKSVTLYTSSFKPFKEIVWKRGKDKVVEWDDQSEVRAFLSFKDRVYLDTVSGNLTIDKLTPSDEDEYGIESPSVRNNTKFTLRVIESLPSPTLSCTLTDGNITLQCMILEDYNTHLELIQYSWDCPSTIQCQSGSKPSEAYVTEEGDLSQEIQCIISNPLFRRTTSVILSTCVPSDKTRHRFVLFAILPALIGGLLFLKCFLGRP